MEIEVLRDIWFALLGALLGAFLILGGIDFGACMLASRSKKYADFAVKSILPFWDANQVWLILAGGALFAAFPQAYSAALSNLYTPVMLLLAALVVRVCAIEFYFAHDSSRWRNFWRFAAAVSAFLAMLILGVALGAIFTGGIFGRSGGFFSEFLALFSPCNLIIGGAAAIFSLAQGALFLEIARRREEGADASRAAFVLLANSMAALIIVATFCAAAYPYILPPQIDISNSSSALTLEIMLGVAGVGVPVVLAYTAYSYWLFLRKN
ncbi:MAG: cytochrome d ubiquinol oxidase subunit II [Opitutales bacterium]|nr:cytochrome d ubiquinol oxidase subunit II [Opitutales bacterium]